VLVYQYILTYTHISAFFTIFQLLSSLDHSALLANSEPKTAFSLGAPNSQRLRLWVPGRLPVRVPATSRGSKGCLHRVSTTDLPGIADLRDRSERSNTVRSNTKTTERSTQKHRSREITLRTPRIVKFFISYICYNRCS